MIRGRFVFQIEGQPPTRLEMAGSEWHLVQRLRRMAKDREQFAFFESSGAPLTPRSLASLNAYLRTGAIRFWRSKRHDAGRELIGRTEWTRFCRMLDLRFDGRGTRQAAA